MSLQQNIKLSAQDYQDYQDTINKVKKKIRRFH